MSWRHIHKWKLIAKTYAQSASELGITDIKGHPSPFLIQGCTTLLWECEDPECQELRQEKLLGKEAL